MARQLPSEIEITAIKITKPDGDHPRNRSGGLDIIPAPVEDGVTQELFITLNLQKVYFQLVSQDF